ncbi:MAG: NifB/NifX family molybdenum-iron cluster-binding protein [Eggerthellaceae bacterium]|nr:NifB/NifX family molybdenum-iron cluster-binding protein [Eggerthellaceae bacterium]
MDKLAYIEEERHMKIAIPSEGPEGLSAMRSGHFGHAQYFTVVEYDDDMNIVDVASVKNVDHDEFGCGGVIEFAMTLGIDGILTAGMGMPPLMRFTEAGITVFAERTLPNVGDAAKAFALGEVARMSPQDACAHH